jgi:hypothetical protein
LNWLQKTKTSELSMLAADQTIVEDSQNCYLLTI